MGDYFNQLLEWISQHPEQAGWVIFIVACAESLAIIGVLVPGVVVLLGAGTLIGSGVLDFWTMCAWAVAGAILGDGLSYALGRHFQYITQRWRWFQVHPDQLQQGIDFFGKYGDISIALGRFFGPLRAIVPLVAGILNMPAKRFYIANIVSAIAWAPAYLAPGILLGKATGSDNLGVVLLLIAGVFAAIIILLALRKLLK